MSVTDQVSAIRALGRLLQNSVQTSQFHHEF